MIKKNLGITGVGFLTLVFIIGASLISPDKAIGLDLEEDLSVFKVLKILGEEDKGCLLYTSPSPRDQRGSRMPSSA